MLQENSLCSYLKQTIIFIYKIGEQGAYRHTQICPPKELCFWMCIDIRAKLGLLELSSSFVLKGKTFIYFSLKVWMNKLI
jgi:hypothetical protein